MSGGSKKVQYELTTLTVAGTPSQLGEAHGEALRERIAAFVPMRFAATAAFLAELGHRSVQGLLEAAKQCMAIHAQWDPEGHAEHLGIARGAGVDPVALYAAANMTDVRDTLAFSASPAERIRAAPAADAEGCSTVLLPGPWTASGANLVAQTWDLNPQDLDYVVAIHRLPQSGPETWSVTCTGCLSLVGLNEHGLAVGTTNIKTLGSRPGVGYMGILHKMLSCKTFGEAAAVCEGAPRAAAHTYWVADGERIADWETTAWSAVRRDARSDFLVRTNHCLVGEHSLTEAEPPSASSRARLSRLQTQVHASTCHDVESLKAVLSDRSDGVDSINRLPEDEQGTATNSVVVCAPASRTLWACRGPADRGLWRELRCERAG